MATLRKRESGGRVRWQVRWRNGGGRGAPEVSESFDTHKDAVWFKGLVDVAGQRYPEGWIPRYGFIKTQDGVSLAEWLPRAVAARQRASDQVKAGYLSYIKHHVPTWLGAKMLTDVTREDIGLWIGELRAKKVRGGKPMSSKTISNVHGFVSSAFNDAVRDGLAVRNPCVAQLRSLERERRPEMTILTPEQVEAIAQAIHPHYAALVRFIYGTGCRFGEAIAMTPWQIDGKARTVRIDRAYKKSAGGGVELGPPKAGSQRTISVSTPLLQSIAPLLLARESDALVFTNIRGGRIQHGSFWRIWEKATKAAEVGHVRIHDLRHSHAAYLISKGIPLLAVSRRLGHATVSITGDVYGHLLPEVDLQVRTVLDAVPMERLPELPA